MTAIAALLLDSIKQYSQALKKNLGIPLSQAQTITAKIHRFSDWHELTAVAHNRPFDVRIRGAAFNRRATPAIRTPAAVACAIEAGCRIAQQLGGEAPAADQLNREARGFAPTEEMEPRFHVDFRCTKLASGEPERFRLNLFDPKPRFVAISATPGWGKSLLGMSMAMAHAAHRGRVCVLDPNLSYSSSFRPTQDGRCQTALKDGAVGPLAPIAGIGYDPLVWPHPPLDQVLRSIRQHLGPCSILLADEVAARPGAPGETARVAEEISFILDAGSAVIWLSQNLQPVEALPLREDILENAVFILGRPTSPHISSAMIPLGESSASLTFGPGQKNTWYSEIRTAGEPTTHHVFQAKLDELLEHAALWAPA